MAEAAVALSAIAVLISATTLRMTVREHREFMRKLRATADLRLALEVAQDTAPDGAITQPGEGTAHARIQLGIRNGGDKSASDCIVNVLVPASASDYFIWTMPDGAEDHQVPHARDLTMDSLKEGGPLTNVAYLTRRVERVGLRSPLLLYFSVPVEVPAEGVGELPVRVKVDSDDMAPDAPEAEAFVVIRTRREAG